VHKFACRTDCNRFQECVGPCDVIKASLPGVTHGIKRGEVSYSENMSAPAVTHYDIGEVRGRPPAMFARITSIRMRLIASGLQCGLSKAEIATALDITVRHLNRLIEELKSPPG
jgi:CRP-like cAMP-binding protein